MERNESSRGWKRWLIDLVAYGVPAAFLTSLLQRLGGAALWIPAPWRQTVSILILGAGLACFQLARRRAAAPRPRSIGGAPVRMVATLALAATGRGRAHSVRVEAGSPGEGARDEHGAASAQELALACFLGALALLVPQVWLRFHCVVPWEPDRAAVAHLYGDPDRPGGPIDLAEVAPPVILAETASGFRGSVLVPPRSRLSPELRAEIELRAEHYGTRGVRAYLDHEPVRFIESLQEEGRATSETVVLFLAVHAAILLLASAGYGFSFHLAEELVQQLVPGIA